MLFDDYNSINETPKLWSYYEYNVNDIDLMKNPEGSIKEYFSKGEKGKIFNDELIKYLPPIRSRHMVSAFFLGIKLYENSALIRDSINSMTCSLEERLPSNKDFNGRTRFLYLWFLTCLFHDAGYGYENLPVPECLSCKSITLLPLKIRINDIPCNEYVPEVFLKNAEKYDDICRNKDGFRNKRCIDHGIAGGILLYAGIKSIFSELIRKTETEKLKGGLYRTGEHLIIGYPILNTHIALVAWTIISHNIWTVEQNDKDAEKYKKQKLENLIYNKNEKRFISLQKHPLLFLLDLVDTIEPVKISSWEYLKRMSIEINKEKIQIQDHPKTKLDLDFLLKNGECQDDKGNFSIIINP